MPAKRNLNQKFFQHWDLNMAYVLGFFAADGNMLRNRRGGHYIEFQVTDRSILVDIKRLTGAGQALTSRLRDKRWKVNYRLQIGSKQWFQDLERLGFTPRKSLTLKLPPIPQEFRTAFVRGYFDGDGGVYFKKYKSKDRKNERWVFITRFTSGNRVFLVTLLDLLRTDANIKGGFIITKANQKGFDLVLSHRDSVALCRFMYNNGPRIYLKRKYRVFQKALKTLYQEELRW